MDEGTLSNLITRNKVKRSGECDLKDLGTDNIWRKNKPKEPCDDAAVEANDQRLQARQMMLAPTSFLGGDGTIMRRPSGVYKLPVIWGHIKSRH